MNIFDVGGLTTFIAVIITLIIGTVIFIALHKIFDIIHFGLGAIITMWVVCCIVGAFIVNFLGGLVGGFFTVICVLIKLIAGLAILGAGGMFIYNKLSGKPKDESRVISKYEYKR
ncbi:hypothetical protein ACH36K_01470 [Clostridium sp. MB05]|uniref:hypothetical protein n=1 Tax=Clostridium sp. MB05 TaxID=3376682 RepID=UPI003981A46A